MFPSHLMSIVTATLGRKDEKNTEFGWIFLKETKIPKVMKHIYIYTFFFVCGT
jgi:hypothetical protein